MCLRFCLLFQRVAPTFHENTLSSEKMWPQFNQNDTENAARYTAPMLEANFIQQQERDCIFFVCARVKVFCLSRAADIITV